MSWLVALKGNTNQFWRCGAAQAHDQARRLDALMAQPQAHATPERPALRRIETEGVRGSQALQPLFAEQRHLLLRIQDAKDHVGLGDARDGVELTVGNALRGRAAYEVQARTEPEPLPVCLAALVNPNVAPPNGRLGIEPRVQALAVAI